MDNNLVEIAEEIAGFKLNVNSYYSDIEYASFVDSLIEAKIKSLKYYANRYNMTHLKSALDAIEFTPGDGITSLEFLKTTVIRELRQLTENKTKNQVDANKSSKGDSQQKLTRPEIYKVVNEYIGVSSGYLGDFSYRTHAEFYPQYCDLDINPDELEGTTRDRFINILSSQQPTNQAKILKGILSKYPVLYFPVEKQQYKQKLYDEILSIAIRLENITIMSAPELAITSEVVDRAIQDAKLLIENNDAISGLDRIHTVLHGYFKAVCKKENIPYPIDAEINQLFKLLKDNHPSLQINGTRKQDIEKILNSLTNIINALSPIRNKASIAHPNDDLLEEDEAMLVINATQTILSYLNTKFK